jgi:nitrous oxidase accessory protein NosD
VPVAVLARPDLDNGDAGFFVGESPAANVRITDNSSYDNKAEGILFRDALGGSITDNQLWGNCVGLLLLTDTPTLPGGNVEVSDNTVRQNNQFCPPNPPAPPESGTGIAIAGDSGVLLSDNTVVENAPSDPSAVCPGGILLFDSTQFGGTVATNNRIVDNTAHDNASADLINQSSGAGNVISDNECGTSLPTGLCQAEEDED